MAYTPITILRSNVETAVFRNIFRIINEYKVSGSSIKVQDTETDVSYPQYTIFIPDLSKTKRYLNNSTNPQNITFGVQIDFDALPESGGWAKCAEMKQAFIDGLDAEYSNLRTANLDWIDEVDLSNEPMDINGQQVFSKSTEFTFRVLI